MPKFVVYQASDGWRWRLKADNGEIVAQGEAYATAQNAENACNWVKTQSPGAALTRSTTEPDRR